MAAKKKAKRKVTKRQVTKRQVTKRKAKRVVAKATVTGTVEALKEFAAKCAEIPGLVMKRVGF